MRSIYELVSDVIAIIFNHEKRIRRLEDGKKKNKDK